MQKITIKRTDKILFRTYGCAVYGNFSNEQLKLVGFQKRCARLILDAKLSLAELFSTLEWIPINDVICIGETVHVVQQNYKLNMLTIL